MYSRLKFEVLFQLQQLSIARLNTVPILTNFAKEASFTNSNDIAFIVLF